LIIVPEIDVNETIHSSITRLRNNSFPGYQVDRSWYKQLPHMRILCYAEDELIGYMGIDFRVSRVGESVCKVLGIIDFCVSEMFRGRGIGTSMLHELAVYAQQKDVEFIVLVAANPKVYLNNGFQQVSAKCTWLRIDEHKNYGIACEQLDNLLVMKTGPRQWPGGDIDWLGYLF